MARPKSDDKRDALVAAATRVIAAQGLSAPTAVIAREAGVANGSLFTYFETKTDLFSRAYLDLKTKMAAAALDGLQAEAPLRDQLSGMWCELDALGHHPPGQAAGAGPARRLRGHHPGEPGRFAPGDDRRSPSMLERARAGGPMRDAPMGFVLALMNSLADATMDFMIHDPANADDHCQAGFAPSCRVSLGRRPNFLPNPCCA